MDLNKEVQELQRQLDEINKKLIRKINARDLVDQIDKMIVFYRGDTITPDSAAVVTAAATLRALLLAKEIGPSNVQKP